MENLGRGVVAMPQSDSKVFVGWRLLATDASDVRFNVYRATANDPPIKLNTEPLAGATCFIDSTAKLDQASAYFVRTVVGGTEGEPSSRFALDANSPAHPYISIPLQLPDGYSANDASVGDLDGDGEYEIVLKCEQRPRDTAATGLSGETILQAYKISDFQGTRRLGAVKGSKAFHPHNTPDNVGTSRFPSPLPSAQGEGALAAAFGQNLNRLAGRQTRASRRISERVAGYSLSPGERARVRGNSAISSSFASTRSGNRRTMRALRLSRRFATQITRSGSAPLWTINLGKNIREGAHYTQFIVCDLDSDGIAEIACKTADGTIDGKGKAIGDANADWRDTQQGSRTFGRVLKGPEYFTIFDGRTGAALATTNYIPARGDLGGWGGVGGNGGNDNIGNRVDRFLACAAYLDGERPSVVMCRGYYGRSVLAAWDWRDGKLSSRWIFDSKDKDNPYSGQGGHQLTVTDVDADGRDEIIYHSMVVDDDGKGLFTTGLRHGDALHVSDLDPERPGIEVFGIHENEESTARFGTPGTALFDAKTGQVIWSHGPGVDVGRGVAADVDPRHAGAEMWTGPAGLRTCKGVQIGAAIPTANFAVWWDGDLLRELLDRNRISKWDWEKSTLTTLLTAEGSISNNGSKATPCLSADILGDWREEVIWRTPDNKELRIYTTTIPTEHRLVTLMHDAQYRLSIAWQNVGYNQPPHPGFFLGHNMKAPPRPRIRTPGPSR